MATSSIWQLGALNTDGYVKHVNSMSKLILTDYNVLLSDSKVDMLATFQMNKGFMTNAFVLLWMF